MLVNLLALICVLLPLGAEGSKCFSCVHTPVDRIGTASPKCEQPAEVDCCEVKGMECDRCMVTFNSRLGVMGKSCVPTAIVETGDYAEDKCYEYSTGWSIPFLTAPTEMCLCKGELCNIMDPLNSAPMTQGSIILVSLISAICILTRF